MRFEGLVLAAAALPALAVAAPDFSNGGTFQIGGSFTPNDVNNGQGNNQGGASNSVVSSVASEIASVTRNLNRPEATPNGDNSSFPNTSLGNQKQDTTMAGVAQPTMGMNMMNMTSNNGTAPISGAAGIEVPQLFVLVAHLAGSMGFL